jgi:hypothetical protein
LDDGGNQANRNGNVGSSAIVDAPRTMNHAHATASSSSGRHTSASADGTNQPSAANESGSSASSSKRKRSAQGCVVAENDVIVEELQKIRGKIRESSHLAGNYGRAIFSLQNHTEPITSAREAKQLRNIGNYIANQIQSILQKHQIQSRGDAPVPAATRAASASEPAARRPSPPPSYSASANEYSSRPPVATAPSAARRPYLPAEGKREYSNYWVPINCGVGADDTLCEHCRALVCVVCTQGARRG